MNEMAGFIDCPKCGRRSYNPNDIAHRYCGACHEYHDQMLPPPDHPDAPKFVGPSIRRMWKELIEAKLRSQFYDALNTLAAAGCDEDALYEAGCEALRDLLAKTAKKGKNWFRLL